MKQSVSVLAMAGALVAFLAIPGVTGARTRTIPVGIKVEAEGGGKGRGMWTQSAGDVSAKDVTTLETLVATDIGKQNGIEIVPLSYQQNCIGVAVVAARVSDGKSGSYIASSVIVVSKKDGTDEFVTHDVLAGPDLAALARSIALQFAAARLSAVAGFWK